MNIERPSRYNRREQEAQRLNISIRTLSNLQASGVIPFIKVKRLVLFDPLSVDEALDRFRRSAVGESPINRITRRRPRTGRMSSGATPGKSTSTNKEVSREEK
jgi:hypothetical protein